jgi:hypothetical protein
LQSIKNDKGQNMKQLIGIFALVITLNIIVAIFPERISAQSNDANYQEFYDQLSPYGQWIENPDYGYVWIPTAEPDFTPYLTNGYWVLTDDGWMWESNYDWGWAPFHYGRWDYNGSYGWFWVPDNQWGPSWVTWRRSEGYYGWAPMRPGVSINVSFGGSNRVPNNRWNFVRDRDIESHDISRNYIDRKNNITIINNSTVINKTYFDKKRNSTYVAGPGRADVQKITGKTIQPVAVNEKNKPGQSLTNNQVQIYRPQAQKNNSGHKPAPAKLTNLKDVKPISGNAQKQVRSIQQQPAVNVQNKINSKQNPSQQRNTNPQNNNISKRQQPAVNPVNKINTKNQVNQTPKPNPSKNVNRIAQPVQPRNVNIPKNTNITQQSPKARTMNPPRQNNITPPRQNNITPPRQNKMTPPKQNNVQPAKSHPMVQPSKPNTNDDKRKDRNP